MNAVIYARISPRPADKAEANLSIPEQLERMRALCVSKGWTVGLEEVDELVSGKSKVGREGFARALAYTLEHKATLVVCDVKRFARNIRDAVNTVAEIGEAGASLVSIKEGLDLTTSIGRFMFHIFSAFAELEREQTSERTREAMGYRKNHGLLTGRPDRLPWGKRLSHKLICPRCEERTGSWEHGQTHATCHKCKRHGRVSEFQKRLVEEPCEMAVVYTIHRMLASYGDMSPDKMARRLMGCGTRNPRCDDLVFWDPCLVRRIMKRFPPPWQKTEEGR